MRALALVIVPGLAWLCFGWAGIGLVALIATYVFCYSLGVAAGREMPKIPAREENQS